MVEKEQKKENKMKKLNDCEVSQARHTTTDAQNMQKIKNTKTYIQPIKWMAAVH